MKKFRIVAIVLVVVLCVAALAGCASKSELEKLQAELDAANKLLEESKLYDKEPTTSVSTPSPTYQLGCTPAKLAASGFAGTYLISTTNPDGTPNVAYIIYKLRQVGDKYYILRANKETLKPNGDKDITQTDVNLLREGQGILIWAANHDAEGSLNKPYATYGLKMYIKFTDDATVRTALKATEDQAVYEVASYLQLG